jgi:ABC-2 type transport system permease protein
MSWLCMIILFSLFFWLIVFEMTIFSGKYLASLLIFTCFVLLYVIFWFSLAYVINSFNGNSIVNAVILICSWIIFLFLLPTAINTSSQIKYPVPSRDEQAIIFRNIDDNLWRNRPKLLDAYLEKHPEHREGNADSSGRVKTMTWYYSFLAYQIEYDRVTEPYESDIRHMAAAQQLLCDKLSFLSPGLLLNRYAWQITNTNIYHQYDYQISLDHFNEKWRSVIGDKIYRREKFYATDFARLPDFYMEKYFDKFTDRDLLISLAYFLIIISLNCATGLWRFKSYKSSC